MYLSTESQNLFREAGKNPSDQSAQSSGKNMASAFPDQDAIAQFKEFTQCLDENLAVKFLKGANNDVETAMNHYFENPERHSQSYQGYDEAQWGQNRYGDTDSALPSFQIIPDDQPAFGPYNRSTAPTRPNSRNSQSSMNVHMDMQESGVIGNSTHFGPATREHYATDEWALTLPDSNAAEIYPDIDAWELFRTGIEPVFMKPLTSTGELPALITILGHIPLVQKVVLEGPPKLEDYGPNSATWWSGTPIGNAKIVDSEQENANIGNVELLAETQRLVAFIMGSERLYGSVEPLDSLQAMKNIDTGDDVVQVKSAGERFLRAWSSAMSLQDGGQAASQLFRNVVVRTETNSDVAFEQLSITTELNTDPITLYQAVDRLIWEIDEAGDSPENRYLSKVAPILVLKITNPNTAQRNLNVDIPAVWYLDRYMEENWQATKQMRQDMAECQREIQKIEDKIKAYESFQPANSQSTYSSLELLEYSVDYLNREEEEDSEEDDEDKELTSHDTTRPRELSTQLQKILSNIKSTMVSLEEEKHALSLKMQQLSGIFKHPTEDHPLKHRYLLRGVCTQPRNVYVPVLSETGEDSWWRMEYEPRPAVDKTCFDLVDVLNHAGGDSREALLVYAVEGACEAGVVDVPEPLRSFVSQDNALFKADREEQPNMWESAAPDYEQPPPYNEYDDDMGQYAAFAGKQDEFEQLQRANQVDNEWNTGPAPDVLYSEDVGPDTLADAGKAKGG